MEIVATTYQKQMQLPTIHPPLAEKIISKEAEEEHQAHLVLAHRIEMIIHQIENKIITAFGFLPSLLLTPITMHQYNLATCQLGTTSAVVPIRLCTILALALCTSLQIYHPYLD